MIFATWFGGFTFYIAVVVPTGTEVLGSARKQGFITQQVTHHLNWISAVAIAVMFWEVLKGFPKIRVKSKLAAMFLLISMLAMTGYLVYVHVKLDGFLDFEKRTVASADVFYQWHRVYLWVSTVQWVFAILFSILLVRTWTLMNYPSNKMQKSQLSLRKVESIEEIGNLHGDRDSTTGGKQQ